MSIWKTLEIDKTQNEDDIKKAYRNKLSVTNPEDNPEMFKKLRAAYEDAINYARKKDLVTQPSNNRDIILDSYERELKELYDDFFSRINSSNWIKIINSEYYVALDSSKAAFKNLMKFIMENYTLPHEVWKIIVEAYDIEVRKNELKEFIPEDFLDYAIANAKYEDLFDYNLLQGDDNADYDGYIELLYQLDKAIKSAEISKQDDLLDKLDKFNIWHPEIEVCRTKNYVQKKEIDTAFNCISKIYEEYPHLTNVMISMGDLYSIKKDFDKAYEFYNKVTEIQPNNYIAKAKIGECLIDKGEFEEARDIFIDLLKINHYDNGIRNFMMVANSGLIKKYKSDIENIEIGKFNVEVYLKDKKSKKKNKDKKIGLIVDESDIKYIDECVKIELAWAYYQNYEFENGLQLLNLFQPSDVKKCEYFNLKGRMYLCLEKYSEALKCFFEWLNEINSLINTYGTNSEFDDINKKVIRYGYANFLIGNCYLRLNNLIKAREFIEAAVAIEHEEKFLAFEAKCELEFISGNYKETINACDCLLAVEERNFLANNFKARAFYELGYYNDAIKFARKAIEIYPYVIKPYEVMLKVFLEYSEYDKMQEIISEYERFEIESHTIQLYKAIILYYQEKDEEALEILLQLKEINQKESDLENLDYVYNYIASIYDLKGEYEDSLKAYQLLYKNNPEYNKINGKIGVIFQRLNKSKEALEFLNKQIEIENSAYWQVFKGIAHQYLGEYTFAKKAFIEVYENDSQKYDIIYKIVRVCMILKQYEEAQFYIDKYIKFIGDDSISWIYECKARIKMIKKDYENAICEYIELNNKYDNRYLDIYAELLGRMGRIDEALLILLDYINSCNEITDNNNVDRCIAMYVEIAMESGLSQKVSELFSGDRNKLISEDDYNDYYIGLYNSEKDSNILKGIYKKSWVMEREDASFLLKMADFFDKLIVKDKEYIEKLKNKANTIIEDSIIPNERIKKALALFVNKNYEESIELCEEIINGPACAWCCYEGCHEAWWQKGQAYERMNKSEEALKCYEKALEICGFNKLYFDKIKRLRKK